LTEEQDMLLTALKDAFATGQSVLHAPRSKDNFDLMSTLHSLPRVQFFINGNPTRFHLPLRLPPAALSSISLISFSETQTKLLDWNRELWESSSPRDWREYLIGTVNRLLSTRSFKPPVFQEPQKLNRRQARLAHLLADYNFQLKYLPGKRNQQG